MDDPIADADQPLLTRGEILAALAFAVLAAAGAAFVLPPVVSLATGLLAALLALITLTDFRHFIIPDVLSLPAIPLGAAANVLIFHDGDWWQGLGESLAGAALAGGAFYLLRWLYFRLRGFEGLGLGDVKLAAVAGAWLGPAFLAPVCLAAALGGIVVVLVLALFGRRLKSTDQIPFGCFLAPAILLFWFTRCYQAIPFW